MSGNGLKEKRKSLKVALIAAGCLALAVIIWAVLVPLEGRPPVITLDLQTPYIGKAQTLNVKVADAESGLRWVWISLVKGSQETELLNKTLPGSTILGSGKLNEDSYAIQIEPRKLGLTDGKAMLRLAVRDYSWRHMWNGNKTYVEKELLIDTLPPSVDVLSRIHNLGQGGSGVVIFQVSEACRQSGVQVGETFYPGHSGYFKDPNIQLAFFALDHNQGPGTEIYVYADDFAGNNNRAGFPHFIQKRVWKKDAIEISDRFLNWKMPEFDIDLPPDSKSPGIDKFLKVNRDLRQANASQIFAITAKSENKLYWEGAFLRLPRSAPKAGFADHRTYRYQGNEVDQQFHLGIDLASTAHSPVSAANNGKVVFTGSVGIYGKTILIDHGFGLFSMYSHLSRFDVNPGQEVKKGETIGYTGDTGLAAGDHLHYSMLIDQTFVSPVEWWDPEWIKNNITTKIDAVRSPG